TLLWSPDGTALATTKQHNVEDPPTVQLWDPATGKGLKTIPIPYALPELSRLVFSPDSKMLALPVKPGGTIVVVDIATGTLRTWKHKVGEIASLPLLVFGRDSTKVYGCWNFSENIYKNEEVGKKKEYLRTEYHKAVVEWDVKTGQELRKLD